MKKLADKIRSARIARGISQAELSQMLGYNSKNVINNWECSVAKPTIDKIPELCRILHITPEYLFDISGDQPSPEENAMLHQYRALDAFGKLAVNSVLNVEYDRVQSLQPKKPRARRLAFDYFDYPASAGTGNFLETETPEDIWVKECPEAEAADFVIPIAGDSMEPTFHDGDKVFVEKRSAIAVGEVGIFIVNGDAYIKEWSGNCLISHNKAYKPIKITENDSVFCCGRVLGVVEE